MSLVEDQKINEALSNSKTIAMVGVSTVKKELKLKTIRKPSIIVMTYLQEFGYKVIPVNPFAIGKKINNENVVESLNDINIPIDIVNVFRPSKDALKIANEAIKIKPKVFWLQFGIHNQEAKELVESKKITYISNKCIKQEYQRLFLKVNPVFPVLLNK